MCSSAPSASCLPTKAFGGRPLTEAFGGPPPTEAFGGRIEWRPSYWLLAVLAALTLLAPLAVLASEMPRAAAWPLAMAALLQGARSIARERARPRCLFVFAGNDAPILLDGAVVDGVKVAWRGPLAFVHWRDANGRIRRLAWWPDTLPPAARRELRLAAPGGEAAPRTASMAP